MKKISVSAIPLLLPLLILSLWNWHPLFKHADLAWQDILYTLTPDRGGKDKVIIIAIDEPSFQQLKIRWPWPRNLHADIVDKVSRAGADVIVFDILFPEPSQNPAMDTVFAASIQKAGNVVLGANLARTQRQGYEHIFIEEPIPVLKNAAAHTGMVNLKPDIDGSIRKGLYQIYSRLSLASAAVETARYPAATTAKTSSGHSTAQPPDMFHIDFIGKPGTLKKVSFYQVLNDMVDPGIFKNKIVLIGLHADSAVEVQSGADAYPTPFLRFTRKMMFGVEIQGNIINTMINHYPIKHFTHSVKWLLFYFLAVSLFWVRKQPIWLTFCFFLGIALLSVTSLLCFHTGRIILEILPGTAAITANGIFLGINEFRASYMERLKLRKAFSSYVAPEVVNTITRNYESLKLGGEKKILSVLFSDIRNFTAISENMPAEALVQFLNDYFKEMTTIVYNHRGTLDKYIGDAIMVIFGAPVSMENHADQACFTALEMVDRLNQISRWKKLKTGIGIATGEMIAGNLGSSLRFDYTVIGDNVNLSSRLEGVTKIYGVSIIISEKTKQALTHDFVCRELDLIRVKGKKKAIKIYELISGEPVSDLQKKIITAFTAGLEAYRARNWDQCVTWFKKVLEYNPEDGPAAVFLNRYENIFRNNPPDENWDGVWDMETK
ncbi:MAG: adenylate/guanylate cyclase domain-containing protein [Thermodesulfobacteriota bacterium]|nr:adenylate/guanylate cyclase domain-containing protein [Thermodesulfobacteriota bacterium]